MAEDEIQELLQEHIRVMSVKPDVHFGDVTTLLLQPEAFQATIDALAKRYADQELTHIASCEARGFLFGPPLALALKLPFVPIRKARRLPGNTVGVEFKTGFTTNRLEIHDDAIPAGSRVAIIDDMVLTGSTLKATCELIAKVGSEVVECGCIIKSSRLQDLSDTVPVFGLYSI